MIGVLTGFGIIAVVIGVGYLAGRLGVGGPNAGYALNRVAFFVTTPALLFTVLADADLGVVFSTFMLVALLSAVAMFLIYILVAGLIWRRPVAETTVGSLASGYVNANNIGLPVAVYVLGQAQLVAPILLLQIVVIATIALGILDVSTRGKASVGAILTQPLRNPMILASMAGVAVTATGVEVPAVIGEPLELIGGAAVPLVLMAFGMSLRGQRPFGAGSGRREIALATGLKVVAMPVAAFLLARFAFGMTGEELFAAVVLAALPTAQNVYNFAARYGRGEVLARDTALLTTILSLPVLVVVAAFLAPG